MELLGLPLEDALALLPETPTIARTAPPQSPKRTPVWGLERVVRVRNLPNGLELLVAREMLGEEKGVAPQGASSP